MAKLEISVDTEAKTMEVKAGGKVLENVHDVHVYYYGPDMGASVEVCQHFKDETTGMHNYVRLTASEKDKDFVDATINREALAKCLFKNYGNKDIQTDNK